jgi:hypothetical protein
MNATNHLHQLDNISRERQALIAGEARAAHLLNARRGRGAASRSKSQRQWATALAIVAAAAAGLVLASCTPEPGLDLPIIQAPIATPLAAQPLAQPEIQVEVQPEGSAGRIASPGSVASRPVEFARVEFTDAPGSAAGVPPALTDLDTCAAPVWRGGLATPC